jgi:hypothetical protein
MLKLNQRIREDNEKWNTTPLGKNLKMLG